MRLVLVCLCLCLPGLAQAQETSGQYDVRALGAKVGDLAVNGTVSGSRYSVASRFETTGVIGAVAGVEFLLQSDGRVRGGRFQPRRYVEEMDTGRRQSRARLSYRGGVARSGEEDKNPPDYAVTDAQQKGAVDPQTALFMVIRDQPDQGLCDLSQRVFDGKRLTELVMTRRTEKGPLVSCHGTFRRVGGYALNDLKRKRSFEVTATYAPVGELMRLVEVRADTVYGPATITRR